MGEHTAISWADSTVSIWLGCTKVSNGPKGACEGCYAQVLVEERFGRAAWGPHAERVETKGWRAQLAKISRLAKAAGRPWFVFVNSLSDFWDNQADAALRRAAFDAFRQHPHLTFLLLTKRPQNIVKMFEATISLAEYYDEGPACVHWPSNCAALCTVVTQAAACARPSLAKADAILAFPELASARRGEETGEPAIEAGLARLRQYAYHARPYDLGRETRDPYESGQVAAAQISIDLFVTLQALSSWSAERRELVEFARDMLVALEGQSRGSKAWPNLHLWDPEPMIRRARALVEREGGK